MTTLEADLKARWRPSDRAVELAAAAFAEHPDAKYVYTGHFLVGKEYGWWTDDVVVEHADEPVARIALTDAAGFAERGTASIDGALIGGERPGTIGYTVHWPSGDWAVFEEILDVPTILKYAREEGKL